MIDSELNRNLRAKYNPDGSNLRNLQLRSLDILKFFDEICRENKLKYWLSYGTCLGAIRHGGFIPWDDDIDIEMFQSDYKKFCKIIRRMPNPKYILQDAKSDPEYLTRGMVKLRDTKSKITTKWNTENWTAFQGAWIDIFCLVPSSSATVWKIGRWFWNKMVLSCARVKYRVLRRPLIKLTRGVLSALYCPVMAVNRLCRPKTSRPMLGGLFLEARSNEYLMEVIRWPFEDAMLPVPKHYDEYLTELYGDYMTLPREEDIAQHFNKIELDL